MSQSEAPAWWADVEHLRETIERRRAVGAAHPDDELAARRRSTPRSVADHSAALSPEPVEAAERAAPAPPEVDRADELAAPRRARAAARREAFDRDMARRSHRGPTPADRRAAMAALAPGASSGRRTVTITGRTALPPSPRAIAPERATPRRAAPRMPVSVGPRPDRIAMWAVVLGFMLILAAAASSHAATGDPAHTRTPTHVAAPGEAQLR
jgi:hypothetical protein